MFVKILQALLSIPAIASLIKELLGVFKTTPAQKLKEISEAIKEVKKADTKEDRYNAARKIQDIISNG